MSENYTGTLPVDIEKNINQLIYNYKIYGEDLENLVFEHLSSASINKIGTVIDSNIYGVAVAPVKQNTKYGIRRDYTASSLYFAFFEELPAVGSVSFDNSRTDLSDVSTCILSPINGYIAICEKQEETTVIKCNYAPSEYIPPNTAIGIGEKTENLLNMADLLNAPQEAIGGTTLDAVLTLTLSPDTTYTLLSTGYGSASSSDSADIYRSVYFNGADRAHCVYADRPIASTSDSNGVVKIGFMKSRTNAQQYINGSAYVCLLEGDHTSAQDDIVPYGYKIPLIVTSDKPNLVNNIIPNVSVNSSGKLVNNDTLNGAVTPIEQGKTYTMLYARGTSTSNMICGFFENYPELNDTTYDGSRLVWNGEYHTFTAPITGYLVSSCSLVVTNPIVYEGESQPRKSTTIPIYIGSTGLREGEYMDYLEQKIYRCYDEVTLKGDEENLYYYGDFEGAQAFYLDLSDNEVTVTGTPYMSCNYYSTVYIASPAVNKTCRYRWHGSINKWSLGRIYMFDNNYTNLSDFRAYLAELYNNGTPLKITYLLKDAPIPIDPPAPFPIIPLETGLNTISSSISDLNVELTIQTGEISQVNLDNQIYNLVDMEFYSMIADEYDNTLIYGVGDYCIHDYQLYKCIFPISDPTDWNEIYWEKVTLADEIIGEQKLDNELTDWEIIMGILNVTFSGINGYYENQLSEIAPGKFTYCGNLQEISLPNISVIGPQTFRGCAGLTTINTSQVTSIGAEAFRDCSSLSFYNGAECITINSSAFQNCTSLQTVSFPKCTTLSASVFQNCTSLQSINLPLCTTIGTRVFYSCYSLAEINLPVCTAIPSYTFASCYSLNQISLPKVKTLASYAFNNCSTLSVLSLPLCSRIGSSGIINCRNLESLYLLSTTRCVLSNNNFTNTPFKDETLLGHYGSIYVPASLVSSYKAATNWSVIADRITAYTE